MTDFLNCSRMLPDPQTVQVGVDVVAVIADVVPVVNAVEDETINKAAVDNHQTEEDTKFSMH